MIKVKKSEMLDYKIDFNDIFLREIGFDVADDYSNYIYDMDTDSILQIKGKYIKYNEELIPKLRDDELDCNLIENFRLAETLFSVYMDKFAQRNGIIINGYSQSKLKGSEKGRFIVSYRVSDGQDIKYFESDAFVNPSLRIFNLICILNHRKHLYDYEMFDIVIDKTR